MKSQKFHIGHGWHLILVIFVLFSISCKKSNEKASYKFIAVADFNNDVFLRSCVQFNDGSYFLFGNYKDQSGCIISKFSIDGERLWVKEYSNVVNNVIKCIPLKNGNILVAGFDSLTLNRKILLREIGPEGNVLKQTAFLTYPTPLAEWPHLDIVQLKSGSIVCVSSTTLGGNPARDYLSLTLLNSDLSLINSRNFNDSTLDKRFSQAYVFENNVGDIIISCNGANFNQSTSYHILVDKSNLNIKEFIGVPSPFQSVLGQPAVDKDGHLIYCTAKSYSSLTMFFRSQERFSVGNEIIASKYTIKGDLLQANQLTQLNKLGCIICLKPTSDGGYIATGCSNQSEPTSTGSAFPVYSNTHVLLIKFNSSLKTDWIKNFKTSYMSTGFDVIQTNDGGYAIGCIARSFDNLYKMMLIKTDKNGN